MPDCFQLLIQANYLPLLDPKQGLFDCNPCRFQLQPTVSALKTT